MFFIKAYYDILWSLLASNIEACPIRTHTHLQKKTHIQYFLELSTNKKKQ